MGKLVSPIVIICTVVAYSCLAPSALAQSPPVVGVDYAAGEIIVTFKPEYMPLSNDVTAAPPAFGITTLDSLIEAVDGQVLLKLIPTYNTLTSELGQLMERKFLLVYGSEEDPMDVREALLEQLYFETVTVNSFWWFDLAGTSRVAPGDTTAFPLQWYFDNMDSGDMSDIDMPEAWAIEQGDPDVVLGIFDSGIMVDRCANPSNWRLHSDFNYFFLPSEDHGATGVLNSTDLNGEDNGGDGFIDNILGTNLSPGCDTCQDQTPAPFWNVIPQDWTLEGGVPGSSPVSWEWTGFNDHGTLVASIAAGKFDGLKRKNPTANPDHKDIVGAAPNCKVYSVRFGYPLGDFQAARALELLATHCRVINMSFGVLSKARFEGDDEGEFERATQVVTREPSYDCVLIAAVGNQSSSTGVIYPARFDSVLAIGGLSRWQDEQGGAPQRVNYSSYSSTEHQVGLLAPIEEYPAETRGIVADGHQNNPQQCVTDPCSDFGPTCIQDETAFLSGKGTSFATPQVSGVVALVRSRFPSLNQFQIKQRLKRSAEFYWSGSRPDYEHGYGKVNAYRALTEWGSIADNTTWSATDTRDGAFYVSGDLTIEAGATLTINPGVVVKVAPDHEQAGSDPDRVQIVVEGTLVVAGTEQNPVVFESFTDSEPTKFDWVGIRFESGSSGSLANVVIKNASTGIENYVALTLTDCAINNCSNGIDSHAAVTLDGCKMKYIGGTGVGGSGPVTMTDTLIDYNGAGVSVTGDVTLTRSRVLSASAVGAGVSGANVTARNSWIEGRSVAVETGSGGWLLADTLAASGVSGFGGVALRVAGSVTCRSSVISGNLYGIEAASSDDDLFLRSTGVSGSDVGLYLAAGAQADVDSLCVLSANDIGVEITGTGSPTIRQSVLLGNTTAGIYCHNGGGVHVANSSIRDSSTGLFCFQNSSATISAWDNSIVACATGAKFDDESDGSIRWTKIDSCTVGVLALNDATPDLGGPCGTCTLCNNAGNNEITNSGSHHVVNLSTGITISAKCNYWGPQGPKANKFSGSVDYNPYLTSPPSPPLAPEWVDAGGDGDDSAPERTVPTVYAFFPGHPNPFNPVTTMRYDVPPPGGRVSIVVYDVSGRTVRVLVNRELAAGSYAIDWDGRDDRRQPVATGVYFVRMVSRGFERTQKLVLVK